MKSMIWAGMFVGSAIGSLLPLLWGGSELSMSSVLFGALGGVVGIWGGYTLTNQ